MTGTPILRSTVSDPDRQALREAVRLHRRSLDPGSMDPLGERSLLGLYESVLRSGAGFLVVATQGADLRGALLATTDSDRVPPVMMRRAHRAAWTVLHAITGRRGALARSIEARSGGRTTGDPPAELMVIAVAPGFRSRGIGRGLLDGLHEELLARGITRYKVLVGRARTDAIRFYLRNGFRLARTFWRWGLEWDVYVRTITAGAESA